MRMRDVLGAIYDGASFGPLLAVRGRPAESPWHPALVTVMQFAEGLSDRQAAEACEPGSTGSMPSGWNSPMRASVFRSCPSSALGCSVVPPSSTCSTSCATAMNLVHLANWLNQVPRATTRCSAFAALAPAA